ncbi:MAG: gluconate 2-dehydrogenase subunit 3 family protein [Ginsengibacter sp.]
MDRRTSIKSLLVISAGAAIFPSCLQEGKKASITTRNLKISGADEELLSEVSESIIPKTDTPGAKDFSAHLFAIMMIDECAPPEDREKFQKGIKAFEDFSKKIANISFVKASPEQRAQILTSLETKKEVSEDADFFFNSMKKLTLQAYTTSEYYLTKVRNFKLVPGKFYGCVPVKKAS